MEIIKKKINIKTEAKINIYNVTPQISDVIVSSGIKEGQALIFSRQLDFRF